MMSETIFPAFKKAGYGTRHYCEPYEYAPGHMWDKRAVGLALKMANASSMLACDTPLFKPVPLGAPRPGAAKT